MQSIKLVNWYDKIDDISHNILVDIQKLRIYLGELKKEYNDVCQELSQTEKFIDDRYGMDEEEIHCVKIITRKGDFKNG